MTKIADFCYLCFECTKNLRDVFKNEEECVEIVQKLKICVSEVDWSVHKKLFVCEKCIKKLIKAHEFKKQCIQSAEALKLYLKEIKKEKEKKQPPPPKKEDPLVLQYLNLLKNEKSNTKPAIKVVPEQQKIFPAITKIILTNQPNSFQNVFLNLLPANVLNKTLPQVIITPQTQKKDPEKLINIENNEVSKLLTNSKMEEVSVEVDPLDFNMESEKLEVKPIQLATNNFRPILPKLNENYNYTNEEKMEFFNSGHFLLQDVEKTKCRFFCEKCLVQFESLKTLNNHVKQVHSSQYPYKCEYCSTEFAAKEVYKLHLAQHSNEQSELLTNSITLTDFTTNNPKINDLMAPVDKPEPPLEEDVKCDKCDRVFGSNQGLVRHQAKQHKSSIRKKYFVKGMKNAKCDICNRMFSTQSYMNLHRKLHDRKGEWRRKIFKPEIEPLQTEVMDMMEKYVYDHSDGDDLDDEEDDDMGIDMSMENVSSFLETSMHEPSDVDMRRKQADNGSRLISRTKSVLLSSTVN